MSHFVSFTSAKNGQVHGKSTGAIPSLPELTTANEKSLSGVQLRWSDVAQLIMELSDERKAEILKALKIDGSLIDTTPPQMVLLDRIDDVTEAGNRAIEIRVYLDDT